jgi:hypothetical protein
MSCVLNSRFSSSEFPRILWHPTILHVGADSAECSGSLALIMPAAAAANQRTGARRIKDRQANPLGNDCSFSFRLFLSFTPVCCYKQLSPARYLLPILPPAHLLALWQWSFFT